MNQSCYNIKKIGDFIESTPPCKILHDWEQSSIEAEYVIKNLTMENQTVLDPMMGSGTTGLAALKLNRKFIGIEKDFETFEMARNELRIIIIIIIMIISENFLFIYLNYHGRIKDIIKIYFILIPCI